MEDLGLPYEGQSLYFREELRSDFMKFGFEKRYLYEESKRPEMIVLTE